MRSFNRRCTFVAVTALVGGLATLLPAAAQATGDSLTLTTSYAANGVSVTLAGTASKVSDLWMFSQPLSSGDCAATPHGELLLDALGGGGGDGLIAQALPVGGFSKSAQVSDPGADKKVICGYLSSEPVTPSDPGSMYATPLATAQAQVGGAQACSDVDRSFAISKLAANTRWQAVSLFRGHTIGSAGIAVTAASPGAVVLTGPSADSQAWPLGADIQEARVAPGSTATYQVTFYPSAKDAAGNVVDSCSQPDGSSVSLGVGSAFHAPAQTLQLTWFRAGQGGSGTVNGVLVPGSSPKLPAVSHKPTVRGRPKVGNTVTCGGVKVPPGDKQIDYAWAVNGRLQSFRKTALIRSDWKGKLLKCTVADESDSGWPGVWSNAVTVRHA